MNQRIYCDSIKEHPINLEHHITVDDSFLYQRVMHFCNWKCLSKWMQKNNFPIKKESIFAIDIPIYSPLAQKLNKDIES